MNAETLAEGRRLLHAAQQTYRHVCILPGNPAEHSFVKDAEAFEAWVRKHARELFDAAEVLSLYEHPGYTADCGWDGQIHGWFCISSPCGQPEGQPHLSGCPVGDYLRGKQ